MSETLHEKLITILGDFGTIPQDFCYKLKYALGNSEMPDDDVPVEMITKGIDENKVQYLDMELNSTTGVTKNTKYVWIETYLYNRNKQPLIVGFVSDIYAQFSAYCVSTYNYIYNRAITLSKELQPMTNAALYRDLDSVISEIAVISCEESISVQDKQVLNKYVRCVVSKVNADFCANVPRNYILNKAGIKIAYKLKTKNIFGQNIILTQAVKYRELDSPKIYDLSANSSRHEFRKSLDDLLPVRLWNNPTDLFIDVSIDTISCNNPTTLNHITCDRLCRFPETMQTYSKSVLVEMINRSIKLDMEYASSDIHWIVPYYNYRTSNIGFLLPLYDLISNKPVLAMVAVPTYHGYSVVTVLRLSVARMNAKVFSDVCPSWLADD